MAFSPSITGYPAVPVQVLTLVPSPGQHRTPDVCGRHPCLAVLGVVPQLQWLSWSWLPVCLNLEHVGGSTAFPSSFSVPVWGCGFSVERSTLCYLLEVTFALPVLFSNHLSFQSLPGSCLWEKSKSCVFRQSWLLPPRPGFWLERILESPWCSMEYRVLRFTIPINNE